MLPTIHSAAAAMRSGTLSPLDLLDQCLARIDRHEDSIRAWVLVDRAGARAQAERLTAEARRGEWRGPLHGIPLGIKDIIDVFDLPTAAGSKLWANSIARQDAGIVRDLRAAGAVILGKTVTTAYASFDPPPTRNPWNPSRTPGGSSSGSAAAVAAGMCLGAIGTQTGGSILRPASYCGVAAFKPTHGLLSVVGILPLAPTLDHPGPMARCVRDLALLMDAIGGSAIGYGRFRPEFWTGLDLTSRPQLGVVRGIFHDRAEPAMREMLARAVRKFDDAGASLVELALPAAFAEVLTRHRTVMAVEAAEVHESRLRDHPEDYGPNITTLLREGLATPAPEYVRCLRHREELSKQIKSTFRGVQAILVPAALGAAPDAATTGDPAFNSPWSYLGMPTVTFPAGRSEEGLPLGLQLVGKEWSEGQLLVAAAWCEEVLGFEVGEPRLS